MKSFNIVHILLFLIAMLAYQCANSQDFAVDTKGDTLRGSNVKIFSSGAEKKIQITQEGGKKVTMTLFQVKSVSYKNEIYQPVKGPSGYTFMKLLKPGYLSLYAFQMDNQVTYDGLFLVKKDGTSTEVPNLSFKKTLKNFLTECPDLVIRIDDGEFSKKDLHQIVDEFNACIDKKSDDQKAIIAVKDEREKKIGPWNILQEKVNALNEFEGKNDALEMITEIQNKIRRSEKIPNFMVEGLRNSLSGVNVQTELDDAMKEIQ